MGTPPERPRAGVGPPPAWPPDDAGKEATRIIRAAHVSAAMRHEEADALAAAIVEQARQEADELLRLAEVEAEHRRDEARRVLAAAQEQAEALVAGAEQRARRVLTGARQDALTHAQQVSRTVEARANEVIEAERATLRRLHDTRRAVSVLIEALAGADPVLGPTVEILRLAVDARMTGEHPALRVDAVERAGSTGPAPDTDDPAARMVRAAVARAMDAAAGDDAEPDDAPHGDPPVASLLSEITHLITVITDDGMIEGGGTATPGHQAASSDQP